MVLKDNNNYLVDVGNIDTAHKASVRYANGTYYHLTMQVRGVKHTLSYGKDEALRDGDYDRLKEAGQH